MTRILIHPIFLELMSSSSLLDRISTRASKAKDERSSLDTNPVWLSEDDLSNMWKVVLKSKLYKSQDGYRMENLAWRLWFYARSKHKTGPMPVISQRAEKSMTSSGPDGSSVNWSPRDIPVRQAETDTQVKVTCVTAISRPSVSKCVVAGRQVPSKSFVVLHDFSLLKMDSSESAEEDTCVSADILQSRNNEDTRTSKPVRRLSKKKKDVDRYLKEHLGLGHNSRSTEELSTLMSRNNDVIKSSPDMRIVGNIPRRVSKGFQIPTRKSNSTTSGESPGHHLSSISSDDSGHLFDNNRKIPNINLPSATYRARKQSFSRSASPQIVRPPVSMLTILMSGQLTMSHDGNRMTSRFSPPSRPGAPVQMYHGNTETILEESEISLDWDRYRSSSISRPEVRNSTRPSSKATDSPRKDLQPILPIW